MRPAIAPARAGKGDAVTDINRADSASEKSNGLTLRQRHEDCNSCRCHDRLLSTHWQVGSLRSVSTTDSRYRSGEPDGLPTAARVLREMRRSRARG